MQATFFFIYIGPKVCLLLLFDIIRFMHEIYTICIQTVIPTFFRTVPNLQSVHCCCALSFDSYMKYMPQYTVHRCYNLSFDSCMKYIPIFFRTVPNLQSVHCCCAKSFYSCHHQPYSASRAEREAQQHYQIKLGNIHFYLHTNTNVEYF